MNITEYRKIIATPIAGELRVGERLYDDPLYEFIDDQMMKVGSLSHASVQWSEVEKNILQLLKDKTKDIKLLIHLIQCLHHQTTPERFTLSVFVFGDFMREFWRESYPSPGDRGKLPRRKFFSLLLQRFDLLIDKFDFSLFDSAGRDLLLQAFNDWHAAVINNELDSDSVQFLDQRIKTKLKDSEERSSSLTNQSQSTSSENPNLGNSTVVNIQANNPLTFDAYSGQSIKQTLLKVAEFLSEQDYGTPLSIRTRRYAVWSGIDSPPEHNQSGETQLRSIQGERLKEYTDGMSHPDVALWRKVEQSLTLAPYWIDGQFLSFKIAESLEQSDWAEAIKDETKQFITRLPQLLELKFKDGSPFVSDETQQWIDSATQGAAQGGISNWQEKYQQIKYLAKEAGVTVAISSVNDGLESAVEPRDKFYWQCLLADLLEENKLTAVASEQYRALYEQIMSMSLSDWEPSLIEKLKSVNNIK
ncbi:type VI secretion system protein TssA [Vibrio rumoiensis]|uniref:type VI secretion system protein TssA n=1 Tax=Vibrio rumoiensis TaxID=76258 RepID=UPI003AA7D3E6